MQGNTVSVYVYKFLCLFEIEQQKYSNWLKKKNCHILSCALLCCTAIRPASFQTLGYKHIICLHLWQRKLSTVTKRNSLSLHNLLYLPALLAIRFTEATRNRFGDVWKGTEQAYLNLQVYRLVQNLFWFMNHMQSFFVKFKL